MAISTVKRKRVSKKTKVAWRKHSKVADIQAFLQDQWDEERLGAPLDTVPNDQLFVLDTSERAQTSQILSRQQRKVKATRPLKGFLALQPHTGVPDPIKKRNRVRTPEERKSALVKAKELRNIQNGVFKAKDLHSLEERRLYEIRKDKKEKRGDFLKDIWSEQKTFSIQDDPWAETDTKVHNLRNTGIPVKKTVKDLQKKKSLLPAVELPHPGMSYNPSYKDHQDLLRTVAEEEKKVIKEEEHIKRVTRDMFRKVSTVQKTNEWIVEMSEGIQSNNHEESKIKAETDDDGESALINISINPPVQNRKKTLQQRRKQREQLDIENQKRVLKREKKKIGDIHKIKVLQNDLQLADKKQAKLRELKKVKAEKNKLKPKVLSSTKFEDPGPEFQMGQDISGNLRAAKKEGSLLLDRFKSLQKRNILEPSKKAHRKKPKVKKYTKPGFKEDWEKTVARKNTLTKSK